jgi:hypothetical protein
MKSTWEPECNPDEPVWPKLLSLIIYFTIFGLLIRYYK